MPRITIPPPPPPRRKRDQLREVKTFRSVKPEVNDPHKEVAYIPPRHLPTKQPAFVRFMHKNGTWVVMAFIVMVMLLLMRIQSNAPSKFDMLRYGSTSTDTIRIDEVQASMENYLAFLLLTKFERDPQGNVFEHCAVAYKLLGGYQNEEEAWLYLVTSFEAGHRDDIGEWITEAQGHYIPGTVKLTIDKNGAYSLKSIEMLPIAPYSSVSLALEDVAMIMPEEFARRIIGHETADAELQMQVDKLLGKRW